MTYKEKQMYLGSYGYHKRRIKALQEEMEQWHTMATNITQKITPVIVHTNDNTSKIERCAIKCSEIESEIYNHLLESEVCRKNIQNSINNVKDLRRKELLEMRYIDNVSVHQISIKLDKAEDNIYKMLRTTIKNMDI